MSTEKETIEEFTKSEYKWGFTTDIETEIAPKGLSEDIVRFISAKKEEPEFMLAWRLKAYRHWLKMKAPSWPNVKYPPIDFQDAYYYAAPKTKADLKSMDEVDPKVRETFDKLGISLDEQKRLSGVAVDAVMDSVSVATTFKEELSKQGIIFCSFPRRLKIIPI